MSKEIKDCYNEVLRATSAFLKVMPDRIGVVTEELNNIKLLKDSISDAMPYTTFDQGELAKQLSIVKSNERHVESIHTSLNSIHNILKSLEELANTGKTSVSN